MTRSTLLALCLLSPAPAEVVTMPDPHGGMPPGKTVVWSPLFQATWDTMNAKLGGPPKKIDPPNELMSRLDAFRWEPATVMPEGAWKTWAGEATPEFLKQVNTEAARMTGEAEGPFRLSGDAHPGMIACFGLLDRQVEFAKPFYRSMKVPLEFGTGRSAVRFFGAKGDQADAYGETVKVLAYRPVDGSHALEISCKGADDKVILYLPAAAQDFATACRWIREWREDSESNGGLPGNWDDRRLHHGDEIRVPYVSIDVTDELSSQLQGGRFHGRPDDPWTVRRAEQMTKFELHEKGARVRVEASIDIEAFSSEPRTVPRRFIFDRPFFVFLWRDTAEWPYLGAWIGDATALMKL
jgi:hypothetical protein